MQKFRIPAVCPDTLYKRAEQRSHGLVWAMGGKFKSIFNVRYRSFRCAERAQMVVGNGRDHSQQQHRDCD